MVRSGIGIFFLMAAGAAWAQDLEKATPWRRGDVASQGKFSVSLEFDSILSRDIEEDSLSGSDTNLPSGPTTALDPTTETDDVEFASNFYYLRVAYSAFAPKGSPFAIEPYLMIGLADAELDGDVNQAGEPTNDFNIDGDRALGYGLGVRARVFQSQQLSILVDLGFRKSTHDADIDSVENLDLDFTPGAPDFETADQDFEMDVFAWHLSAFVSYRLTLQQVSITPYAGIRVSFVDIDVGGSQTVSDPTPDKEIRVDYSGEQETMLGVFLGAEAALTENLSVFLDARLVDETAVTFGAGWKF